MPIVTVYTIYNERNDGREREKKKKKKKKKKKERKKDEEEEEEEERSMREQLPRHICHVRSATALGGGAPRDEDEMRLRRAASGRHVSGCHV